MILADRAARNQLGVQHLVALAETLQIPVVDLGGRMNFPTTHHLNLSDQKRALVRDADVILMLDVGDPWGQLNTVEEPMRTTRSLSRADVKAITIGFGESSIRSNYQDFQRFLSVDLAIHGEVQASMPVLTEHICQLATPAQRSSASQRREPMQKRWSQQPQSAKDAAALAGMPRPSAPHAWPWNLGT